MMPLPGINLEIAIFGMSCVLAQAATDMAELRLPSQLADRKARRSIGVAVSRGKTRVSRKSLQKTPAILPLGTF
jgi:hypothetical protein